jgi:hypothetical protein
MTFDTHVLCYVFHCCYCASAYGLVLFYFHRVLQTETLVIFLFVAIRPFIVLRYSTTDRCSAL